jgi:hypothetical protein
MAAPPRVVPYQNEIVLSDASLGARAVLLASSPVTGHANPIRAHSWTVVT